MAGALINLGIPECQARRYEDKIKEGNILISVRVEDSEEIARAKEIFTESGGEDICVTGATLTEKQPVTQRASRPSGTAYMQTRPRLPE